MNGRSSRVEALATELRSAGASAVRVYLADLASLAEVRAWAGAVRAREPRLDALVNNTGIGKYFDGSRERRADVQAYDAHAYVQLRELSERLVST